MGNSSDLLNNLLEKRGISADMREAFLVPSYERDFHDPFLMRDMEKSCVRIFEAMEAKEKILIFADYDCDGIPGAVILSDLFKLCGYENSLHGGQVEVYIPQRNSEGYGLNLAAIQEFAKNDVKLIITIDLGITAVAEVAQAEVLGMDVIITDHHLPPAILPRAYAILNPKCDEYVEKMLCGAGVAFKLAQGFIKKYGEYFKIKEGAEKWLLDMAGLATLSDMVPLLGENRAIAHFGMKVLRKSPRPGLQKLLAKAKIDQKFLSEDDIGYMLTPRLNAASRMSDPRRAFELLSAKEDSEAGALAEHLSDINDERKLMVAGIMREVNKKFSSSPVEEMREVIVIGNPAWRIGVLGLVAGKITDTYKKPAFVWGRDENDIIKGSCRSDGTVSVVELMTASSEHFSAFGGHEGAGGFSVHNDKIHFLEDALSASFMKAEKKVKEKNAAYDAKINLADVNLRNYSELEKLAPFGEGNPKPVFLFEGVKVEKIKKFGKATEHIELLLSDATGKGKAVSFFAGPESFSAPIAEGLPINLLATFDLSRFAGRVELRLRITDVV